MPASKLSFKENRLKLEVEGLEITAGLEVIKVDKLSVELDVNDLLRTKLPALTEGRPEGINFLSFGDKKIMCIKEVRAFTGLGLKESKELVEQAPNGFIDTTGKSEAACEAFVKVIEESTGCAELVRSAVTVPSVMDKLREMLSEVLGKDAQ